MTCAAKRGSHLRNGLSSAIRTLVFCSAEIPHDRWPCDRPQVVLAESLPHLHMRESPRLGVLSCSVHYRSSK